MKSRRTEVMVKHPVLKMMMLAVMLVFAIFWIVLFLLSIVPHFVLRVFGRKGCVRTTRNEKGAVTVDIGWHGCLDKK